MRGREREREREREKEREKNSVESPPAERTQHPWLVLSHARIQFTPSEFQGLSTVLLPKCLRIKR